MFKFSFNWLQRIHHKELSLKEVLDILELQGFEVKSMQDYNNDKVIMVEVKANRPDFLCHRGVLREILAFKGEKDIEIPDSNINIKPSNKDFPININIQGPEVCKRFTAMIIRNINNNVETPSYIKESLEALGVNCINPVVDIANYVMLEYNQPMHSYDIDKVSGNQINVSLSGEKRAITTLAQTKSEIESNDIVIADNEKVLCVAGIIGENSSRVEENTKNIMLESAIFDEVKVRLSSRRLKISTPSSFRFERGVDVKSTETIMLKCAELIKEICGGDIEPVSFDYYPNSQQSNIIPTRVSRTNKILGTNLTQKEIIDLLEKYYFICKIQDEDVINVEYKSYRLDLEKEINIIEEIARIYGYHNITPKMPKIEIGFTKNETWENMDQIRNILVGLGFFEVITYSFIPSNTMKTMGLEKGHRLYSDLVIQNPISQSYSLMRPTMLYSLADSLAYNYSRNNYDLALFELGRTYFKDSSFDTGVIEKDTLAMITTGSRLRRGFGINKDIKYSYYDMLNYIDVLLKEFGLDYTIEQNDYPFFVESTGCDIKLNGKTIGIIGEVDKKAIKNVQNSKLLRDGIFFCEIYLENIKRQNKRLRYESKFPPVTRQYNFLYNKNIESQSIIDVIKSSSDIVKSVTVEDIYTDKLMPKELHAVLFEVTYSSKEETLSSQSIENVENTFIPKLKNDMNVVFR